MRWTCKATVVAMVFACAAAPALGQIKVGARSGDQHSGSTIGRGVIKQDQVAIERKAMETSAARYLDKAEEAFAQNRYALSCQKLRRAKSLLVTRALAERWGALGEKLNAVGGEQIAKADEAFENKKFAEAKKLYKGIWLVFAGLPASRAAQQRLRAAKADPDAETYEAEGRAAGLLKIVNGMLERHRKREADKRAATAKVAAKATTRPAAAAAPVLLSDIEVIRGLGDSNFLRVADLLDRIATEYATTPTGQEAAGLFQTLNEGAGYKQRLDRLRSNEKATKDLAKANVYCDAGLLAKAAVMYREIVKKYPGTAQANQANRQLGIISATAPKP